MGQDVLRVLGSALKKVMVGQSSYVNGPDADWETIAALVILQCDGKVAIMSQATFDAIANIDNDLPIPFSLGGK